MHLPMFLSIPLVEMILRNENRKRSVRCPILHRKRSVYNADRRAAFEDLWQRSQAAGPNTLIDYHLPYPRIEFLHYLCDEKGLVTHGSNRSDLEELKPIRLSSDSSEFGNRQQIFCSPDASWAAWFAIINKASMAFTSNGCVRVGSRQGRWVKIYFFHLRRSDPGQSPFCPGMIYIAREQDFPARRVIPALTYLNGEIEEWGSPNPVTPLARLPFQPDDFPYLSQADVV